VHDGAPDEGVAMAARFVVSRRHIGTEVEHRPKIGKVNPGRLIKFEKRGRFDLAMVEFQGHNTWVDRADLFPVAGRS
jgi:hypothetical protein